MFITTKGSLGLILGVIVPKVQELGTQRGPKQAFIQCQYNKLCTGISIVLKLYHNVKYHKQKVGIYFLGNGANSLGIKGQKGTKNKLSCSFFSCPEWLLNHLKPMLYEIFENWSYLSCPEQQLNQLKSMLYIQYTM